MKRPCIRVIKVGGSLFDFAGLPRALESWLGSQPPAANVLIAGGGPLADFVCDAQRRFGMSDTISHWLCIDLLEASAALLVQLVPSAVLVQQFEELQSAVQTGDARPIVFAAARFLREQEAQIPGRPLTQDWRTTSDSIAARIAQTLGARELVLLKSCPLPAEVCRARAAELGLVDALFPDVAADLVVRWVNLRSEPPAEARLAAVDGNV